LKPERFNQERSHSSALPSSASRSAAFRVGRRQNVCNNTNNPTPTAGPIRVASTNIMNDFATMPQTPQQTPLATLAGTP
jgi:hypothetical protein